MENNNKQGYEIEKLYSDQQSPQTTKDHAMKSLINVEYHPFALSDMNDITEYMRIPFTGIAALGAGLSSLSPVFRTVTQTVQTNGGETLYRAVFKDGVSGKLLNSKDGIGKLGTILKDDGGFAQARWVEANVSTITTSTVMPFDPTTLFMSAALMSIEKRLGDIQETQQEILDFLQASKKAEQRGNLTFLADILNNYKYNWNNAMYKSNMHLKVQDIKQKSEENIKFYRGQIQKTLQKSNILLGDQDIKNRIKKLIPDFREYQLSVYLHGFSSFLEVMLLGNYDNGYLGSIIQKMEQYSYEYRELYTECYNKLENNANSSMQSYLRNGLANLSENAGNVIAKIPVINKSPIDEFLIGAGNTLEQHNSKKAGQTIKRLVNNKDCYTHPFIENIRMVDRLYNQPTEILFDKDNIYLCQLK